MDRLPIELISHIFTLGCDFAAFNAPNTRNISARSIVMTHFQEGVNVPVRSATSLECVLATVNGADRIFDIDGG